MEAYTKSSSAFKA